MVPLLYDCVVFFMVSLLLEEDAASQESVSSTVGAPCNEASLCNRAVWLGKVSLKNFSEVIILFLRKKELQGSWSSS